MTQIANTYESYDAVGNREELADKIYMTTPEKTPFLTLAGRKSVSSVHPEWQTDTLASPDTSNNQPEGNDWSYDAITPTTRVGNYTQISEKSFIISRTQENTSKAGRKSEKAREATKKLTELKIDMEVIGLSNQAASAGTGNGATNRTLAGLRAWLATNDSLGSGGASGSFSNGIQGAATNGTQRALTKALIDDVVLSMSNAGGEVDGSYCMMSNYNKTVASRFLDDADIVSLRKEVKGNEAAVLIGAVDAYLTDFGLMNFVPNVQMTRAGATIARNVFVIDPKMVSYGIFDDIQVHKPAKTGDADKYVTNVEYTLLVMNEAGLGVVADTYGISASS